jgi:prepilin peptidase CpaA
VNLIVGSPSWLIVILLAAIAAAAIEDAIRLRISNITCAVVLVAAIVAMGFDGFPLALWQNAVVFVVVLAIGTAIFAAGQMGGGDVKLLACLGVWMGFGAALWLVALTLMAGGVLAIGFIATRPLRRKDPKSGKPASKNIPYGLAIAAGACIVFCGQLGLFTSAPTAATVQAGLR